MMYERQDLDIASSILRDRDKSYSTLFCCSNSTTPMSYNERRSEEAFYFKGIFKTPSPRTPTRLAIDNRNKGKKEKKTSAELKALLERGGRMYIS